MLVTRHYRCSTAWSTADLRLADDAGHIDPGHTSAAIQEAIDLHAR
jgi:hypothetical protein